MQIKKDVKLSTRCQLDYHWMNGGYILATGRYTVKVFISCTIRLVTCKQLVGKLPECVVQIMRYAYSPSCICMIFLAVLESGWHMRYCIMLPLPVR